MPGLTGKDTPSPSRVHRPTDRLDSVQGARAQAAWLVVLSHGLLWGLGFGSLGDAPRLLAPIAGMGVMIFFTISGFIMVHTTAGEHGAKGAASRFMLRRIVRVVPLYWLMTGAAMLLAVKQGAVLNAGQVVRSLLFIPYSSGPDPMRPILGVGWTLNYEMLFYVCYSASLLLKRGLALLFAGLIALTVVGQFLNPLSSHHEPETPVEAWTDPILLLFVAGMVLGVVRRNCAFRFSHALSMTVVGVAAVCIAQATLVDAGTYPLWWRLAIMASAVATTAFPVLAKATSWTPAWLVHCGGASYSIYLVHPMLFGISLRFLGLLPAMPSAPVAVALYVLFSSIVGLFIYRLIERPLTRKLGAVVVRRTSPPRAGMSMRPIPLIDRYYPIGLPGLSGGRKPDC